MITVKWKAFFLPMAILAGQVFAVDPSPADKAKWDAACQKKSGPTYRMVFNLDGTPTGRCEAPPVWACYFGPYTDPKTGKPGCCGKGNGIWSVDPAFPKEGKCCVAPAVFSFDAKGGKGDCCEPPKSWHMDPLTGSGSCCANSDDTYTCDCSCKENPIPTCPKWHGRETTQGGKKWKLYCNLIYHGTNDLGQAPATDWADCMVRCAGISNCVRAIFEPRGKICYLRTHGNTVVPTTPDPYLSAHLIPDPAPIPDPPKPDPPKPEPVKPDPVKPDPVQPDPPAPPTPSKCPEADNKIATVGGVEYKFYCNNGFSDGKRVLAVVTAKDGADCAAQCSTNPKCQGVNFFDDGEADGCVMTEEHESPPQGGLPGGPFLCAIPTKQRT